MEDCSENIFAVCLKCLPCHQGRGRGEASGPSLGASSGLGKASVGTMVPPKVGSWHPCGEISSVMDSMQQACCWLRAEEPWTSPPSPELLLAVAGLPAIPLALLRGSSPLLLLSMLFRSFHFCPHSGAEESNGIFFFFFFLEAEASLAGCSLPRCRISAMPVAPDPGLTTLTPQQLPALLYEPSETLDADPFYYELNANISDESLHSWQRG